MDKLVDFSQPMVATSLGGQVAIVETSMIYSDDKYTYLRVHCRDWAFHRDGTAVNGHCPWTVRNATAVKRPTFSNEELTQRMEIERELYIRMEAFIQRWSEETITNLLQSSQVKAEAKALKADLPKPVDPIDPDLIEARRICEEVVRCGQYVCGRNNRSDEMQIALECIKLGRTLAAGGTAHE